MDFFVRFDLFKCISAALTIAAVPPNAALSQSKESVTVEVKLPGYFGPIGSHVRLFCPPDMQTYFDHIVKSVEDYEADNEKFQASVLEENGDEFLFELSFVRNFVISDDTSWEIVRIHLNVNANRKPGRLVFGGFLGPGQLQRKPWLADGTEFREKYDAYSLDYSVEVTLDGLFLENEAPATRDDIINAFTSAKHGEDLKTAAQFVAELVLEAHSVRGFNYDVLTGGRPIRNRDFQTYEQACGIAE